jgi:hypothetical protein
MASGDGTIGRAAFINGGVTMRRLIGVCVAGAILTLAAFVQQAAAQAPEKALIEGDVALLNYAIRPDKTADYEQFLAKLKEALTKSTAPEAKQQLAAWKVVKMTKPMPDGNILYTHVLTPVAGADYNFLQVMYSVFTDPTEQKAIYDLYRGALAGNLGMQTGTLAVDLGK